MYCAEVVSVLLFSVLIGSIAAVKQVPSMKQLNSEIENAGKKLVVVDFHASFCNACRSTNAWLDAFEQKHKEVAVFLRVNTDLTLNGGKMAQNFNVTINDQPTFVFLKNGKAVKSVMVSGADTGEVQQAFNEVKMLKKEEEM